MARKVEAIDVDGYLEEKTAHIHNLMMGCASETFRKQGVDPQHQA